MPTDKFAINDSSDDNPLISTSYPRLLTAWTENPTFHSGTLLYGPNNTVVPSPQVFIDRYC